MPFGVPWGRSVMLIAMGACAYTATNSLGWSLARRERYAYAIPMVIVVVGSLASIVVLLGT